MHRHTKFCGGRLRKYIGMKHKTQHQAEKAQVGGQSHLVRNTVPLEVSTNNTLSLEGEKYCIYRLEILLGISYEKSLGEERTTVQIRVLHQPLRARDGKQVQLFPSSFPPC